MDIEIPGTELLDAFLKEKDKKKKLDFRNKVDKNVRRIINALKAGVFTIPNCGSVEVCEEIIKLFSRKGWKVEMFETSHTSRACGNSKKPAVKTGRHLRFSKSETCKNDNSKRSKNTKTRKKAT